MVRFGFNGFRIFMIFIFLLALVRSFSHARQVKGKLKTVNIVTDHEKEFAAEVDINFSLHKETDRRHHDAIRKTGAAEAFDEIGRNMETGEITVKKTGKEKTRKLEQGRNSNRVTMAAKNGEQNWKDYFMNFSSDYRTPKSHPPKNN